MLDRCIITGRLIADPDMRYDIHENPTAYFGLVNKMKEHTPCVAYGDLAKTCGIYLKKGKLIAAEGHIRINPATKRLENVIEDLQILDFSFYNKKTNSYKNKPIHEDK